MERSKASRQAKVKSSAPLTSFTRNVKGTSQSKKEKETMRNMKKREKHTGKGKHIIKVENHPHTN